MILSWICLCKQLPFKVPCIVPFCHPAFFSIVYHLWGHHLPISMRKKKITYVGSDIPYQTMSPVLDLDPVTNDQLREDVWNQLRERLKGTSNEGTAS
jgi:hypothetical protein